MKNHEGYSNPTAGIAVRHSRHRKKQKIAPAHLTYLLKEVSGFPDTEMILGKCRACRKQYNNRKKHRRNADK